MLLHHVIAWGLFLAVVLVLLAVDLLVLHRKPHVILMREALIGALIPVCAATLFIGAVYWAYEVHFLDLGRPPAAQVSALPASELPANSPATHGQSSRYYPTTGPEAALMFVTGYLVELSLSADNVFLFVILMAFFKVPPQLQHRVLFWGVMGALVMRGIMILAGAALLTRFEWIIYLFGAFLLYTGIRMLLSRSEPKDPSDNIAIRMVRKLFPVKDGFDGQHFFTRIDGKRVATTLFLVLVCIEFTDLVFALDSIPAIFGITRDAFIVFTSNVFAILGLRSMYFLLAGIMDRFHLLKYGLALVLGFVGLKMVLPGAAELLNHFTGSHHGWEIDKYVSLAVIVLCLAGSIVASLLIPSSRHHDNPLDDEGPPSPDQAKKLVAPGTGA